MLYICSVLFEKIYSFIKNGISCLRRLSKEYDGVDAWRIQKTYKGVTFRALFPDSKSGGMQESKKKAIAFLHVLNSLIYSGSLSLSFRGKKKNAFRLTRPCVPIDSSLVDLDEINRLLHLNS